MKVHVLPGDALTEEFKKTNIDGEILVCRECLVEGEVKSDNLEDFWHVRAGFIGKSYGAEEKDRYYQGVAAEFEKLQRLAAPETEINLWFENELFCQVNFWFCLYLLRESRSKIFRVAPTFGEVNDVWKGFGGFEVEDLRENFGNRIEMSQADILLGARLWTAYQNADLGTLEKLSRTESPCFPHLAEVCRAEIEKNARPKAVLREILTAGKTDFADIFSEFSARAKVYGFGDSQVQRILAEI
jgi:hypothetical protein